MEMVSKTVILLLFTSFSYSFAADEPAVKRGRNEGTYSIAASNVISNGNISAYFNTGIGLTATKLGADATLGAFIGLADLMQFGAAVSLVDYKRLGTTEAHLQITTPKNSRLRLFGFAISGDLYLSSALDTLSKTADSTKPEFTPYPLFSAITDFDLIAGAKKIPLKLYFKFSLSDNPDLLFEYKQLSFKYGVELKKYKHSLFLEGQTGIYKEKYPRKNTASGYSQYYSTINPGGRYRIGKRFSLLASLGITILSKSYNSGGFEPKKFSLSVKFLAPLVFRESETEAIRSLIFIDRANAKKTKPDYRDDINDNSTTKKEINSVINEIDSGSGSFDMKDENEELIKQRKEVQEKMDKIEKMLQEDMQ